MQLYIYILANQPVPSCEWQWEEVGLLWSRVALALSVPQPGIQEPRMLRILHPLILGRVSTHHHAPPPPPAPYGAWVWAGGPQNTSDTYSGTAVKLMVIYPRLCVGGKNLCLPPTLPLYNLGFCTGQLIDWLCVYFGQCSRYPRCVLFVIVYSVKLPHFVAHYCCWPTGGCGGLVHLVIKAHLVL